AAVGDLPVLVRDRVLLAAVDALARRLVAEPRPEATARERELARPADPLRDLAARRDRVRVPRRRLGPAALADRPSRVPRALARRRGRLAHAVPLSRRRGD